MLTTVDRRFQQTRLNELREGDGAGSLFESTLTELEIPVSFVLFAGGDGGSVCQIEWTIVHAVVPYIR